MNLQDMESKFDDFPCKLAYSMESTLETYAERLASAMKIAGFGDVGGQSALAKAIGCRPQTINQALNGLTLGALYHVRVCMRLGIQPLWLVEGRGHRYDPAGPRPAMPGGDGPTHIPAEWEEGFSSEQGIGKGRGAGKFADLTQMEQEILTKLRNSSALADAVGTIVRMIDPSRT